MCTTLSTPPRAFTTRSAANARPPLRIDFVELRNPDFDVAKRRSLSRSTPGATPRSVATPRSTRSLQEKRFSYSSMTMLSADDLPQGQRRGSRISSLSGTSDNVEQAEAMDLRSIALVAPWWRWPNRSAAPHRVLASAPEVQPLRMPLRSRVLPIGGAPPPSLYELSHTDVRVPSKGICRDDRGVVFFSVEVRVGDAGAAWCVRRRFSECREFAKRLVQAGMAKDIRAESLDPDFKPTKAVKRLEHERSGEFEGWEYLSPAHLFKRVVHKCSNLSLSCETAAFPRRHFRSLAGPTLEERRLELERWLQRVLRLAGRMITDTDDEDPDGRYVQVLDTGRIGTIVACASGGASTGDALTYKVKLLHDWTVRPFERREMDLLPEGWRPWMAEIPCFFLKGRTPLRRAPTKERSKGPSPCNSDLELLEVRIPEGSGPGETLLVEFNGREVVVEVPSGCAPGSVLEVWYDAGAGTLGLG